MAGVGVEVCGYDAGGGGGGAAADGDEMGGGDAVGLERGAGVAFFAADADFVVAADGLRVVHPGEGVGVCGGLLAECFEGLGGEGVLAPGSGDGVVGEGTVADGG